MLICLSHLFEASMVTCIVIYSNIVVAVQVSFGTAFFSHGRFYGLVQEDITDSERRLIHRQVNVARDSALHIGIQHFAEVKQHEAALLYMLDT